MGSRKLQSDQLVIIIDNQTPMRTRFMTWLDYHWVEQVHVTQSLGGASTRDPIIGRSKCM